MIKRNQSRLIIGLLIVPIIMAFNNCSGGMNAQNPTGQNSNSQTDSTGSPPAQVSKIALGQSFACALVNNAVSCWGLNSKQQFGNGTNSPSATPVQIPNVGTGVKDLEAGDSHVCALYEDGSVKCWGYSAGGIGAGNTSASGFPVLIIDSGVKQIAARGGQSCALMTDKSLKCWGSNQYGQLGDNSTTARLTPTTIIAGGVEQIAMGGYHTCAILENGSLKCWGSNITGQIGDGTQINRLVPTEIFPSGVTRVALSSSSLLGHSCAVVDSKTYCWGFNGYGQLGDGTITMRTSPVLAYSYGFDQLSLGGFLTCGLSRGYLLCWGQNDTYSPLGDGTLKERHSPVYIIDENVLSVKAAGNSICAIVGNGLSCWGDNAFGQIGDGTRISRTVPVPVYASTAQVKLGDFVGTWNVTNAFMGGRCSPFSFSISINQSTVTISPRVYNCGTSSTTLSFGPMTMDQNHDLWTTDAQPKKVGSYTNDILTVAQTITTSGNTCNLLVNLYTAGPTPKLSEWISCTGFDIPATGDMTK